MDYRKNAESLGAASFMAKTAAELRKALAAARKEKRTSLIYVPIEVTPLPGFSWWDVPVAEESLPKNVRKARNRYES